MTDIQYRIKNTERALAALDVASDALWNVLDPSLDEIDALSRRRTQLDTLTTIKGQLLSTLGSLEKMK